MISNLFSININFIISRCSNDKFNRIPSSMIIKISAKVRCGKILLKTSCYNASRDSYPGCRVKIFIQNQFSIFTNTHQHSYTVFEIISLGSEFFTAIIILLFIITVIHHLGEAIRFVCRPNPRTTPAFPFSKKGQPLHCAFRSRLDVHSRYGLPVCRQSFTALFLSGSDSFVSSTIAEIAPGRDDFCRDGICTRKINAPFHGVSVPLQHSRIPK